MTLRNGFALGDWTVYPLEGRLSRAGEDRRVQPKSMEVLLSLAGAEGQVVERETLLREIWGERAVSDEPLTRCIGELRRALGDDRSKPDYILTIPKRGYRLLQAAVPAGGQAPAADGAASRPRGLLVLALAVVVIAVAALVFMDGLQNRQAGGDPEARSDPSLAARSIVVLPFADMSESGDQDYMSDGIAEELLNLLAQIPDLRVISRTSAFSFKGRGVDVRDIAEQLGVAYVLEGSVRTSGDRVRITTQLIDARIDSHLWAETYDRELENIFAIQDEIAAAVVSKLELTLLSDAPRVRTTDPEAYSFFLQARHLHEQPAGDSFQRAFDYYQAALEIDENYVPAWVWLAALYDDTVNSSGLPYEEVGQLARDAIGRALAIDPDDPLALGMSAVLLADWDDDLVTAAARMQRAVDSQPRNPILLRWAAILLNFMGRHGESARIGEYLFARDPVGNIAKVNLASTYLMAGRFEDAVRVCEIQVAVDADVGPCLSRLIVGYLHTGRADLANELLETVDGSRIFTRLAPMVFYALGRPEEFAQAAMAMQQAYEAGDRGMAYWLARTYSYAGEVDEAIDWLELAARDSAAGFSPETSYFLALHGDPRWEALLRETGRTADRLHSIDLRVPIPASGG